MQAAKYSPAETRLPELHSPRRPLLHQKCWPGTCVRPGSLPLCHCPARAPRKNPRLHTPCLPPQPPTLPPHQTAGAAAAHIRSRGHLFTDPSCTGCLLGIAALASSVMAAMAIMHISQAQNHSPDELAMCKPSQNSCWRYSNGYLGAAAQRQPMLSRAMCTDTYCLEREVYTTAAAIKVDAAQATKVTTKTWDPSRGPACQTEKANRPCAGIYVHMLYT